MAPTRNSANREKTHREAVMNLCVNAIAKTDAEGFFDDPHACASSYVKIAEYRRKLNSEEFKAQGPSDTPDDFIKAEEFDQVCSYICEKLETVIPTRDTPETGLIEDEPGKRGSSRKESPSRNHQCCKRHSQRKSKII